MPTVLPAGTLVAGGVPGQSAFYTTPSAVSWANNEADSLYNLLQIQASEAYGYRPGFTIYQLTQDTPAAYSRAWAIPQFGVGGGYQYFIPSFGSGMSPLYSARLNR